MDPTQDTSAPGSQISGNQSFIENLFATGVSGFVDSQYANIYNPNDPHNFNAGRPAGISTARTLTSSPAVLIVGVLAVGALIYFIAKK